MEDKFCTNCGSKITAEAEFCGNCGAKQIETEVEFKDRGTISMFDENSNLSGSENSSNGEMLNNVMYGQPTQTPPKKKNTGLIIGIVAAVLLVLAFIGMTAEKSLQNAGYGDDKSSVVETDDYTISTDSDDEKEYVKGTFTDTTYVSDFIGIKYTAPDGWVLATESDLAQMPTDPKTTWEMQAVSGIDGSNVIVAVEKLPTENFSESMYISSLKNTLKNNTQITVSDIQENGTKMIAGKEYHVLTYTASQSGVNYTQTFYLRKINAHMVALTVTSLSTSEDEILSNFTAY